MRFFATIKKYWSFFLLIGIPLARGIWKLLTASPAQHPPNAQRRVTKGDAYTSGDIIDVEVKKE